MQILVVDDDPDARELAVRALRAEFPSAEFLQAMDAKGLESVLAGKRLDILVSDYDLRWSDGFEVLAKVRAAFPECCCVMFTGTGNEELAVRALKAGFEDYIVKSPAQLRRLAAAVRAAYDRGAERQNLAEARDLLLRELYHRLHNNLQIVISLVNRTARRLSNIADRELLEDLNSRIQAISLLQEAFYQSNRLQAVPLHDYIGRLVQQHEGLAPNVEIATDLQPVEISVQAATPLALIANELLTNALKHAFRDGDQGRVVVELKVTEAEVTLRVSDNGRGEAAAEVAKGALGMELMTGLARQVGGRLTHEAGEAGWTSTIVFGR